MLIAQLDPQIHETKKQKCVHGLLYLTSWFTVFSLHKAKEKSKEKSVFLTIYMQGILVL